MKKPQKNSNSKAKSPKKKYEKPILTIKTLSEKMGDVSIYAQYNYYYGTYQYQSYGGS